MHGTPWDSRLNSVCHGMKLYLIRYKSPLCSVMDQFMLYVYERQFNLMVIHFRVFLGVSRHLMTNVNIAHISYFLRAVLSEQYRHEAPYYMILCICRTMFSLVLYYQLPSISLLCYDLEINIRCEVFTMIKIVSGVQSYDTMQTWYSSSNILEDHATSICSKHEGSM